jgi:pimeloyl-ACP methyl ester carboxylesterase
MDGTGLLFQPLLETLPLETKVQVVTYSYSKKQTLDELTSEIKRQLPSEPFILLTESFGGSIAFQLSLDKMIPVKKLLIVASFLSSPLPTVGLFVRHLPLTLLLRLPIPKSFARYFCFGKFYTESLFELMVKATKCVDPAVLANRLKIILKLQTSKQNSEVETVIVIAKHDRLVSGKVSGSILSHFSNASVITINGPHFLAQTRPEQLVSYINDEK